MKDCLIVGGGISALLAADQLRKAGFDVLLLDRARSVGGRMATRRLALSSPEPNSTDTIVSFDFGAQFFTARFSEFEAYVQDWLAAGVAVVWHRGADGRHPRYRGVPDMKSIPEHLAAPLFEAGVIQLEERARSIHRLDASETTAHTDASALKPSAMSAPRPQTTRGGWRLACESGARYSARSVLLTAPAPQCIPLLEESASLITPGIRSDLEARFDYRPCFALMLLYDSGPGAPELPPPGYANNTEHPELTGPAIRWLADNRRKGVLPEFRALTVHATADFSAAELESDPRRVYDLLTESCPILRGARPREWRLHRWLYSEPRRTTNKRPEPAFYTVSRKPPLLLAGDAYGGGRVEGAAISGLAAANALREHLDSV
ncbi:MAG: NAD(P)-binding protein [Leptospirales bacterium]|jgi:renalase